MEDNENVVLKLLKKKVKRWLIIICIIVVILLLIAGFILVLLNKALGSLSKGVDDSEIPYIATDSSQDLEPGINITDEQIEELVKILEKNDFTVQGLYLCGDIDYSKEQDDPENIESRNKYLRQFLKAELCTFYPDFKIEEDETHFNGIIQIKRASENSDGTGSRDLEYVRKDIFDAMIEALQTGYIDPNLLDGYTLEELEEKIKEVYSIDEDRNLYYATWTIIEEDGARQFLVEAKGVNYQKAVQKYAMPIEVPLTLCFTSQNPEYVYQFIEEYVLNGQIDITIQDTQRVDTYESWYDYSIHTEVESTTVPHIDANGVAQPGGTSSGSYDTEYTNQNAHKKVVTTVDATPQITFADTWMATETILYTNNKDQVEYPLGQEKIVHEDVEIEGQVPAGGTTSDGITTTTTTNSLNWSNFIETENINFNEWERNIIEEDTADVERKTLSILEQWDTAYRIPNTQRKEAPGENLVIGDQVLLGFLDTEDTQAQEQIFKYLLYRYTGDSYGVKELDLSIFDNWDFEFVNED
ncbi:MAG: hypothetical protein ACI4VQ_07345 [Clostridia bacterium]